MTHYLYAFLALDMARERTAEAERERAAEAEREWLNPRLERLSPAARLRRFSARILASVSRGFASIVRVLDERVADDLGRTLASAK